MYIGIYRASDPHPRLEFTYLVAAGTPGGTGFYNCGAETSGCCVTSLRKSILDLRLDDFCTHA